MENVTIKHVSKESGYSLSTVSRVLSGSEYPVSEKAKAEIIETAERLGYVSNMLARSLKTCRSQEIAVIIPSITNPFYTSIITGVNSRLSESGYNMLIYICDNESQDIITSIRSKMIDGIIIAADCITPIISKKIHLLEKSNIPYTIVDYAPKTIEPKMGVFFSYCKGGELAASILINHGHTNIAFATRSLNMHSRNSRYKGFSTEMSSSDVSFDENDTFISVCDDDFEAGREIAVKILLSPKKYTAIAASNDAIAVGIIAMLTERGVSIPKDISVIGFDDCVYSHMTSPLLTTIRVPSKEMGILAAEILLDALSTGKPGRKVTLEPEITERESVRYI